MYTYTIHTLSTKYIWCIACFENVARQATPPWWRLFKEWPCPNPAILRYREMCEYSDRQRERRYQRFVQNIVLSFYRLVGRSFRSSRSCVVYAIVQNLPLSPTVKRRGMIIERRLNINSFLRTTMSCKHFLFHIQIIVCIWLSNTANIYKICTELGNDEIFCFPPSFSLDHHGAQGKLLDGHDDTDSTTIDTTTTRTNSLILIAGVPRLWMICRRSLSRISISATTAGKSKSMGVPY